MEIFALPTLFYCLIAFSTFLKFCIAVDTYTKPPGNQLGVSKLCFPQAKFLSQASSLQETRAVIWAYGTRRPQGQGCGQPTRTTYSHIHLKYSPSATIKHLIFLNKGNLTIWYLYSPRAAQTAVAQLLGVTCNQSFLSS